MSASWLKYDTNHTYIIYGNDQPTLHIKCDEILTSLFSKFHLNAQEVPSSNGAIVRVSQHHHEFDIGCCYNTSSTTEYINYVKHVSSFKRIDNKKHLICVYNIHLLKPSLLRSLKCIIQKYMDRTSFVLTTTKISYVPRHLCSFCILVRCPTIESPINEKNRLIECILWLIENPTCAQKARELAYMCVTFNISYCFFSKTIIDIVLKKDSSLEKVHEVVQFLASNEIIALKIKKDVMVWEMTLLFIMSLFTQTKQV